MMKKNKLTIALFIVFAAVLLSGCTGTSDATETKESETQEISHEPIEYEGDFAEDDDMMEEESTEEMLDGHEEEAALDEAEDEKVTEEYSDEVKDEE